MTPATWYFDVVSPFAYLQSRLLHRFAGKAEIARVPVLFAGLLAHWKNVGPAEFPPKRLWTYRFCTWLAARHGIPFRMPPRHPFNPLACLRLAVALDAAPGPVQAMLDFIWAEGRDPSEPAEWAALCRRLDVADADDRIADPEVKDRLRSNTEAAIAAGVFGVPSLVIGGDVFWGVDGTDFALARLEDPDLLRREVFSCLETLPAGVERKR